MKHPMLTAAATAANLIAAIAPAFSQDTGVKTDEVDKSSGSEGAAQKCECPCPEAGDKEKKTKIIYVGPRQNIPVRAPE